MDCEIFVFSISGKRSLVRERRFSGASPLVLLVAAACALPASRAADGPSRSDASNLTAEQAAGLVKEAKGPLVLDGIAGLAPEVALSLARHARGLSLDGLAALDADTARALALHGRLVADIPEDIDVDSLLGKLADLAGGGDEEPDLDGLEQLLGTLQSGGPASDEAADADDGGPGPATDGDAWLSLGGLRTLQPEIATALALHEGPLLLDGVESLSPETAAALAAHAGELSLAGLTSLPADVRAMLAEHDGPVVLPDALLAQ